MSRGDMGVCACLFRLVAMMKDEHALGEEEREEAGADQPRDVPRVAHCFDRFREHVEERDCDDDPAGQRDQRAQVAPVSKRRESSDERRQGGQAGERDRDPSHQLQRAQIP
jgi:hypothetical protein